MIHSPLALALIAVGIVALSYLIEGRFRWGRQVGASLLAILFGALASNLGLVAASSPVYDFLTGPLTSLAIVWLLLGVRLEDLKAAGPRMVAAFLVAAAATAIAAVVVTPLLHESFPGEGWKLGGVLTGTYSGGSVNFAAVGRELDLPPELYTAATAADNIVTGLWMGATLLLPLWLGRFYPRPPDAEGAAVEVSSFERATVTPLSITLLLSIGLAVLLASQAIASVVPFVPSVLWLSTLALLIAQVPAIRRIDGSLVLGAAALNLFFVAIGIASRFADIVAVGFAILFLTLAVVLLHGLLLLVAGRFLHFDIRTLSIASQAAIGGPSTALALATAKGWDHLRLPAVAVGLLGYAVGTYLGLAVAYLLRAAIG